MDERKEESPVQFVKCSPNDNRRRFNWIRVKKTTRIARTGLKSQQPVGDPRNNPVDVYVKASAPDHSEVRMSFGSLGKPRVELGKHNVVTMQNMNEMTMASLNAGIKVRDRSAVLGLSVEKDPPFPHLLHDGLGVVLGRAIVNDLYLHVIGARRLR